MIAAWPRRRRLIAGLVLAALLIAAASYALAAPRYNHALTPIAIEAKPIASFDNHDPARTRFGALEFRGGLVLTVARSPSVASPGCTSMPTARISLASPTMARGCAAASSIATASAAVADAEMAPVLDANGKPLAVRGWFDDESLENPTACSMSASSVSNRSCASTMRMTG